MTGEDIGQDRSAYAVPGTGDGAGNDGHRIGGHEEGHRQIGPQTGILHTNLDREGTLLGGAELEEPPHGIAQHISDAVMEEYHTESEQEE